MWSVVCGPLGGGPALASALAAANGWEGEGVATALANGVVSYRWPSGTLWDAVGGTGEVSEIPSDVSLVLVEHATQCGEGRSVLDLREEPLSAELFTALSVEHAGMDFQSAAAAAALVAPATALLDELRAVLRQGGSDPRATLLQAPSLRALRVSIFKAGGRRLLDLGRVLCALAPREVPLEDEWAYLAAALSGRPYSAADVTFVIEHFPTLFTIESQGDARFVRPASALAATILTGEVPISASEHYQLYRAFRERASAGLVRSDTADAFVAAQLPRQALAAQSLLELARDPVAVLASDPTMLIEAFEADPNWSLVPEVKAILLGAHRLAGADRASQLELSACRLGLRRLTNDVDLFFPRRPWRALWAEAKPVHCHRVLLNIGVSVLGVAQGQRDPGIAFAAGSNGSIWRLEPYGAPVQLLDGDGRGEIRAIAVGADEARDLVLVGASDRRVSVVDGAGGGVLWTDDEIHSAPLSCVAIAGMPGGSAAISAGVGGQIWSHDLITGSRSPAPLAEPGSEVRGLYPVDIGGRALLVYCCVDGRIGIIDMQALAEVAVVHAVDDVINSVVAVPDGDLLVVVIGTSSGRVLHTAFRVRPESIEYQKTVSELSEGAASVNSVSLARGGGDGEPTILTGCSDGAWRLTAMDGRSLRTARGHVGPVWAAIEIEARGKRFVLSSGNEGTCRLWQPDVIDDHQLTIARPVTHRGAVTSIRVHAADEGNMAFITGGRDGAVRLWMEQPMNRGRLIATDTTGISAIVSWSDKKGQLTVASGSVAGTIHLSRIDPLSESDWETTEARVLGVAHDGITVLGYGPSSIGPVLVSGGADGSVTTWDPRTAVSLASAVVCRFGAVEALCALPDVGRGAVAVGGQDGTLSIRNSDDLAERGAIRLDTSVRSLAALPVGGGFAAGLADGRLAIARSGALLSDGLDLYQMHLGPIRAVTALIIGGRTVIASIGLDRRLRLFDLTSRRPILDIELDGYALCLESRSPVLAVGTSSGAAALALSDDTFAVMARTHE